MNPGELRHRIDILLLKNKNDVFTWETLNSIWAKAEVLDKTNIFSKIGIGVKSVKFTIRKRHLTLHQAIKWQGRHYFLTDILDINRMYYEITAAQIEPKICIATRQIKTLNELNRPVLTPQTIATFPGCLVEKYLGYQREKPHAVNEITYVLITPKAINLKTGDLVKIDDDTYNVQIPHVLDEYKNEYEISSIKDV